VEGGKAEQGEEKKIYIETKSFALGRSIMKEVREKKSPKDTFKYEGGEKRIRVEGGKNELLGLEEYIKCTQDRVSHKDGRGKRGQ